jgi:hypothetical protein
MASWSIGVEAEVCFPAGPAQPTIPFQDFQDSAPLLSGEAIGVVARKKLFTLSKWSLDHHRRLFAIGKMCLHPSHVCKVLAHGMQKLCRWKVAQCKFCTPTVIGIAEGLFNMMSLKAVGIFSSTMVIMTGMHFPIERFASFASEQEDHGQRAYKPTRTGNNL